ASDGRPGALTAPSGTVSVAVALASAVQARTAGVDFVYTVSDGALAVEPGPSTLSMAARAPSDVSFGLVSTWRPAKMRPRTKEISGLVDARLTATRMLPPSTGTFSRSWLDRNVARPMSSTGMVWLKSS